MKFHRLTTTIRPLFFAVMLSSSLQLATAQTPGVIYTWGGSTVEDWFHNFGAGTANLANSGGAFQITETSATAGTGAAYSDGFNTIHDASALFPSGSAGGLDLTGLTSLQFDIGQNGSAPVSVQFFTQASPSSSYVALGPDISILPGMGTYTLPLTGLTADQIVYMRTIGINIRDHTGQGNLTWTINEVRSVGTPLTTRVIADHDGGPSDFDGAIINFDGAAVAGGNGGQNNVGLSVVNGALHWTDLGGGPGAAITWGNGTQNSGGSFNARPVDLSNYDQVIVRMKATGTDPSLGVQFYMQTGSGFNYQSLNNTLTVDGQYHDLVFSLTGINNRSFVDTDGINLFSHAGDLAIDVDSVIYVPEPSSGVLLGGALIVFAYWKRKTQSAG